MNRQTPFERGAAVISIDTEQIWGYLDLFDEQQFEARYPNTREIHDRLLTLLTREGIGATWTVVGMFAQAGSKGPADDRLAGVPAWWTHRVPAGSEKTRPLWYARTFVERLKRASVAQEIGMHGGISHLVWGDPRVEAVTAARELRAGMQALAALGLQPSAFVFPRDLEAHHQVLRDGGIRCFRGRAPILSERFGYGKFGALVRTGEEIFKAAPPIVQPVEFLPGLWNLPASMFIYSLGRNRSRFVAPRLRVERTRLGLTAAAAQKGIFHLGLHPENLAESDFAFSVFEAMIHQICRRRDRERLEVLTMTAAVDRVAANRTEYATA